MGERRVCTLGTLVDVVTGFPFKSRDYVDDGIRLLRGDNIAQGRLRWEGAKHWPPALATDMEPYFVVPGDVVLAMDRPWIESGLKYAPVRAGDVPALLVQRVARLRARDGLEQGFLRYLIGSPAFTDHVLSVQTGTAVPHISARQIREFKFALPSAAEQRAIAEVLGALDDGIDSNGRLILSLRELAKALLHQGADPALSHRVGDVAEVRKGLSYTGAGLGDTGMPMVNLANAAELGWLKRSGFKHYTGPYKPRHIAEPGALLVSGVDLTWRLRIIGWPMLLPDDVGNTLFSQDMFLIDFKPEKAWLRLPLWAHLFTPDARARLESMAYGTTVARFPTEALTGLEFPAAPQDARALEAADLLLQRAWAAERESSTLAALRDTLLPPLISGELRVKDAESLVGEAV